MAKLAQAIDVFSEVLDIPRPTVEVFTRPLRDLRMISTGGRGKNAPDMNARDLAVILLAPISGGKANQAAKRVLEYGEFVLTALKNEDESLHFGGSEGFTEAVKESIFAAELKVQPASYFIDAIVFIIENYSKRTDREEYEERSKYISDKYNTRRNIEILALMHKEESEGMLTPLFDHPSFSISATEGPRERAEITAFIEGEGAEDLREYKAYFLRKFGDRYDGPSIGMNIKREVDNNELYAISRLLR